MTITHISAITFSVRNMTRSVTFYRKLGFQLVHGGEQATFSSLRFGKAFVNLAAVPAYQGQWWGRAIFRVDNADAYHRTLTAAGLQAEQPTDAPWGERYFHLTDPDGHELSFAQLLPPAGPNTPTQ